MKNNLTCEIVEDLMPSYIDGLTSDVTNKAVREHLSQCGKCNAKLDAMAEPCSEDKIEHEKKEIDFLKKNRRKNIRTKLISLLAVVLVVAVAVCTLPYVEKESLSEYELLYDLEVQGNTFKVTMIPTDKDIVITDIDRSSYGIGERGIDVKGRKASPFDNRESVTWEYTYEEDVRTFKLWDKILWEDGEYISDITAEAFKRKHLYIGDAPANSQLARELGIDKNIGSFSSELQTKHEPYGWTLVFTDELMLQEELVKSTLMRKYAYVLLALINNVDSITFRYEVFNPDRDDRKCELTITRAQADEFFGDEVRKCYEDINELQKLMEKSCLADRPFVQRYDEMGGIATDLSQEIIFRILNRSDSDIKSIHMTWLDGNNFSMGYGIERDFLSFGKSRVNPREYDFDLDELSENKYDEKRLGTTSFKISVYDFDENEYVIEEPVEVSANFGAVYYLVLDGTFEDGFTVKIK